MRSRQKPGDSNQRACGAINADKELVTDQSRTRKPTKIMMSRFMGQNVSLKSYDVFMLISI